MHYWKGWSKGGKMRMKRRKEIIKKGNRDGRKGRMKGEKHKEEEKEIMECKEKGMC